MDDFRLRLKHGYLVFASVLLMGVLGVALPGAHAQDEPIKTPDNSIRKATGVTPSTAGKQDELVDTRDLGIRSHSGFGSPRRRGALRRTLTSQDIQNVIAVAQDVSPVWADSLNERLKEDPDSLGESIRLNGRRLLGLAMLRDRDPALYGVRVGELRCNRELSTVSVAYREALRDDRSEDVAELQDQLRVLVKQSLDFELRARAMELAALDKALRELKSQLQVEIVTQDERLEQRLSEVMAAEPPAEPIQSDRER